MKRKRRLITGKAAPRSKTVGVISDETSEIERLMNDFENHESHEAMYVRKYREIFERMRDPLVKFLVELILADEEKHYKVLESMTSTLKGALTWTRFENAIEGLYNLGQQKEDILNVTEEFIQAEKREIVEYRKLMRASKRYYQGLFTLFLAAMIHDSEKHIEILKFLGQKLKAPRATDHLTLTF